MSNAGTDGTQIQPPMDLIFDYFRGFQGTAVDMRRKPELLEQAVEALYPYCDPCSVSHRNRISSPDASLLYHDACADFH
jgi:hypothetical protein